MNHNEYLTTMVIWVKLKKIQEVIFFRYVAEL